MSKRKKFTDSLKRPSPTRRPNPIGIQKLSPKYDVPYKVFVENIDKIKLIVEGSQEDEIFRFGIVLLGASLDKYIHDIVKVLLIDIFKDELPESKNFNNFLVPIGILKEFDKNDYSPSNKERALSEMIYDRTSVLTAQKYAGIQKVLSHCISINIFKEILPEMNRHFKEIESMKDLTKALDSMSDRRNKIVHELDYFPNTLKRHPITKEEVNYFETFISAFVRNTNDVIMNYVMENKKGQL